MKRLSVLVVAAFASGALLLAQGRSSGELTTTTANAPDSVLGAAAHAVGTIILFPFRPVGDALGLLV
jgi:uncharacterized membrane protein YdcZ (DUF606 family)